MVRAGPWEDATDLYKQIVKQLGCDAWGASALDCLLAKEKDTLLNVSDSYYGNCSLPHKESIVTTQWAPAMDGVILPQMPVSSTPCSGREVVSNQRAVVPQVELLEAGKVAPVAVLLGSNKDEGSTFITHPPKTVPDFYEYSRSISLILTTGGSTDSFEELTCHVCSGRYFNTTFGTTSGPLIAKEYFPQGLTPPPPGPAPSPWDPGSNGWLLHNAAQDAVGDFDLRCPTVMAARTLAQHNLPTFLYSYDHQPYESVNEGIVTHWGAFHGASQARAPSPLADPLRRQHDHSTRLPDSTQT